MPSDLCPACGLNRKAALAEARTEATRAQAALLRECAGFLERLLQWDHLPYVGDGPFWMREARALLSKLPAPEQEKKA